MESETIWHGSNVLIIGPMRILHRKNYADCKAIAHEWCVQNGGCGKEDGTDNENCAINMAFRSLRSWRFPAGCCASMGNQWPSPWGGNQSGGLSSPF